MKYQTQMQDDFDRIFRHEKQHYLCYSRERFRTVSEQTGAKVIGYARRSCLRTEHTLRLRNRQIAVFPNNADGLLYRTTGYVPVNDRQEYIALQESRLPLLSGITCMAAALCLAFIGTLTALRFPDMAALRDPAVTACEEANTVSILYDSEQNIQNG